MPEPTPSPVEPEVSDRIPFEPEQMRLALDNYIIGRKLERVVCFRSQKDGRERYLLILDNDAALLFAPAGQDLVMTLIRDVTAVPPTDG